MSATATPRGRRGRAALFGAERRWRTSCMPATPSSRRTRQGGPMKKIKLCSIVLATCVLGNKAIAGGGTPAWSGHAAPLTFLFGNDFDTHQQSQIRDNGDLAGALYIHYTGVVTSDGLRVASHADCNSVADCSVGWTMLGKPR